MHGFSVDDDGVITLRAEPELLAEIERTDQITNIYVLDKSQFKKKSSMEWRAKRNISPLGVIFVRGQDLSELVISPPVRLEKLKWK